MPRVPQVQSVVCVAALSRRNDGITATACAFAIPKEDTHIQILPAGAFRARDGRPIDAPQWFVDAAVARSLIEQFEALKTPPVIDYEHQTLNAESNGHPAPAAGFFRSIEWREGVGLFGDVEWTARAKQYIADGEYRYFSPVFSYDKKTGRVEKLLMGALVNNPALDGLQEITARAAARFQTEEESPVKTNLVAALCAVLGFAATATEEEVTQAVAALKAKADGADQAIAAAKAQVPDPKQYVSVSVMQEMQTELAALRSLINGNEVDRIVRDALADGRLLPAQDAWARSLGASNIASLKAYVESATPVAALKGTQTGGKSPAGSEGNPADEDLAVCKQLGIDPASLKGAAK